MRQLCHPDEGWVTNSTAASLIAAKHTSIQLNIRFLLRALEHYSPLIHLVLEIVTVLRTQENCIINGVYLASLEHFMDLRFHRSIFMIPSICKGREIKSFTKVIEKIIRMRIQTYSPFQTITPFTEGFYLIYHHFPLSWWLATEGPWEFFEESQGLCFTHHPNTDSHRKMWVSQCTRNWS